LLDVVVVGPLTRRRFLRLFPRVFAGTHVTDSSVSVFRGRQVGLEGSPRTTAYADGEWMGTLPLTSTVAPGALRVIGVPAARSLVT
jgi:diacylglycerol kinase (ATP)